MNEQVVHFRFQKSWNLMDQEKLHFEGPSSKQPAPIC